MISEKELVKSSRNLPVTPVENIGENALIAFNQFKKDIVEHGLYVGGITSPKSTSTFFFFKLPDGTISMGKLKAGNRIFERISVN